MFHRFACPFTGIYLGYSIMLSFVHMSKILYACVFSCSATLCVAHLSDTIKSGTEKASKASSVSTASAKILAVVGTERVITEMDLVERIKLILITSRIPINADNIKMLREQVLKNMIDEYVQLMTAEKYKVLATDAEIDETLQHMAKEGGTTVSHMKANFAQHNVSINTLRDRIKAQLSWLNFVRAAYGHNITVRDEDVDARMQKNKDDETKNAYHVYEIFLRADGPGQQSTVKNQADLLIRKLKEGADFRTLARQFSNSPSAARGGDLGFVPASDETSGSSLVGGGSKAYESLLVGQISFPVQTTHGYYIYMLADKRVGGKTEGDKLVSYKRILIPLTKGFKPEEDPYLASHMKALSAATSQAELFKIAKEHDLTIDVAHDKSMAQFPNELKQFFESLPVGQPSQPMLTPEGMMIMVVTDKKSAPPPKPLTRDEVKQQLEDESLTRVAAQNLNDLIRKTRVELRAASEFPGLRYDYV